MAEQPLRNEQLAHNLDRWLPPHSRALPHQTNDPLINAALLVARMPSTALPMGRANEIQSRILAAHRAQFAPRQPQWQTMVARLGMVAGLAFVLLIASLVPAMIRSVPGEPLYAFKQAAEKIELSLAFTSEAQASAYLHQAERRAEEATILAARGNLDISLVYDAVESMNAAASAAAQTGDTALQAEIDTRQENLTADLSALIAENKDAPSTLVPTAQDSNALLVDTPVPTPTSTPVPTLAPPVEAQSDPTREPSPEAGPTLTDAQPGVFPYSPREAANINPSGNGGGQPAAPTAQSAAPTQATAGRAPDHDGDSDDKDADTDDGDDQPRTNIPAPTATTTSTRTGNEIGKPTTTSPTLMPTATMPTFEMEIGETPEATPTDDQGEMEITAEPTAEDDPLPTPTETPLVADDKAEVTATLTPTLTLTPNADLVELTPTPTPTATPTVLVGVMLPVIVQPTPPAEMGGMELDTTPGAPDEGDTEADELPETLPEPTSETTPDA